MIKKDVLADKCPFGMENHEECTFYRKGIRTVTTPHGEEQVPIEECAINIIADCLENLVGKQVGLQKEMNLVRNETEKTNLIFGAILNHQQQISKGDK